MSTPHIKRLVWCAAQGVLRGACVQGLGQSESNIHRWLIHNNPHPLRPLEEIRANLLVIDQETDGLQVEIVGVAL